MQQQYPPLSESMATILRQIQAELQSRGETVATAESCTGGLVATFLTDLAGSSAVYVGGVSAYANSVKVSILGVSQSELSQFGAVSASVAKSMAAGVRDCLGATYGISLTGIAGPGGGTAEKPVGTVYCGMASSTGEEAVKFNLSGDRSAIRRAAAEAALRLFHQTIGAGKA